MRSCVRTALCPLSTRVDPGGCVRAPKVLPWWMGRRRQAQCIGLDTCSTTVRHLLHAPFDYCLASSVRRS